MNLENPDGTVHISMKVNISMRMLIFFFFFSSMFQPPSFFFPHFSDSFVQIKVCTCNRHLYYLYIISLYQSLFSKSQHQGLFSMSGKFSEYFHAYVGTYLRWSEVYYSISCSNLCVSSLFYFPIKTYKIFVNEIFPVSPLGFRVSNVWKLLSVITVFQR